MFAKIRWVCKVQSLGKHKNGWVKKKYSLGSGETKFPLGRGKKSTGSGSTGSVTEGCFEHPNGAEEDHKFDSLSVWDFIVLR